MAGALVEQDRSSNSSSNHTASTLMGPLSCSNDESYKYIVLPLCYSVTFLLSVVLNSTVILRSYRSARRWNASLIYMVNLASTDLMYSMSLPLLVASYVMRDHWVFGDFMCRLVRFLFYFNLYCSIFFLTCISVHRYMGICHPMRTIVLESKRAVKSTCAMVWVVVFLLTCPIFRFAQTGKVMSVVENGAAEYGGANLGSTERLDRAEPETYTNCYDVATDNPARPGVCTRGWRRRCRARREKACHIHLHLRRSVRAVHQPAPQVHQNHRHHHLPVCTVFPAIPHHADAVPHPETGQRGVPDHACHLHLLQDHSTTGIFQFVAQCSPLLPNWGQRHPLLWMDGEQQSGTPCLAITNSWWREKGRGERAWERLHKPQS
ncbi:C-X-C chemokine receptor type 2 isoform X3 [Electrophorus electricus]|uniref:C-X-C chemokine receptor type 2 isoform X3 n=1 Tax=Electrophorus electricus TaxID=8005 RepID=UPI0015D0C5AA|nr:C-X-C chemokine receptor type 2 isoform X3 [Electrophorus electricus]